MIFITAPKAMNDMVMITPTKDAKFFIFSLSYIC